MEEIGLITQARARITWGDPPASVHQWLTSNGMQQEQAARAIEVLLRERNQALRKRGIRKLLLGGALMIPGIWALHIALGPSHQHYIGTVESKGIGAALGLGIFGLWKLINGAIEFLRPQTERGEISDIRT